MSRTLLLVALVCAALCGPRQAAAETSCELDFHGYVGGRDTSRDSVIIFVHGVLSDGTEAWKHQTGAYWPCMIRRDGRFDEANVNVVSYPTTLGRSPTTDEVAKVWLPQLQARGVFSGHTRVAFVAHSMGGLVVTKMLLALKADPAAIGKVRLVQFFGTPAGGAEMARLATWVSPSEQFAEMADPSVFKPVLNEWLGADWKFRRLCYAEGSKTSLPGFWSGTFLPSVQVVPQDSASKLCNGRAPELYGRNHFTIVKPELSSDDPAERLHTAYAQCLKTGNGSAASVAGSDSGKAAIDWLLQFTMQLAGKDRVAAGTYLGTQLRRNNDGATVYYVGPRTGMSPNLSPDSNELFDARQMLQAMPDHIVERLGSLQLESVVPLGDAHRALPGDTVPQYRRKFVGAGVLDPDDLAIVLAPRDDADRDRLILFISKDLGRSPAAPTARFKGFAVSPWPLRCDPS